MHFLLNILILLCYVSLPDGTVHLRSLTWNPKMKVSNSLEDDFPVKRADFMFHVNFRVVFRLTFWPILVSESTCPRLLVSKLQVALADLSPNFGGDGE